MFIKTARQRSLSVYHLHMGGPDAAALEWLALLSPRFAPRLRQMGVSHAGAPEEADVVVVTGLLLDGNLDWVLAELARMPQPSVIVAAGDSVIDGGKWKKADLPALAPYALGHYADIPISVPGDPPTPQALIAALAAAQELIAGPGETLGRWDD